MTLQFHKNGYTTTDPRIEEPQKNSEEQNKSLPDAVDVLVVGAGPAGMIAAAQLSRYPEVSTVLVERNAGPLTEGRAEGVQARSVETFQAFGFADQLIQESYRIMGMNFWRPDPNNESHIYRAAITVDDPHHLSEFPHLISNQPAVLQYFADYMANSSHRMKPHYGVEYVTFESSGDPTYPLRVHLLEHGADGTSSPKIILTKYLLGADGAHSAVRRSLGKELRGDHANRAWGVLAALGDTDFPDIRMKCAIQSTSCGSLLLIPREGGHLFRMYVDLGDVPDSGAEKIRETSAEEIIDRINMIMKPYSIDVKHVAWRSVYEVGHRITDGFDACIDDEQEPRIFIAGDACHTHSAKAGQGMNVSFQDGFNIAWKLGQVASGISPSKILKTYSMERFKIAKDLVSFDREWYSLFAKKVSELEDSNELEEYYVKKAEFAAGFMTEYSESPLSSDKRWQSLAQGFPIGKRFRSHKAVRVCDANPLHIGHLAAADGRWRVYVFADSPDDVQAARFAEWLGSSNSPLAKYRSATSDDDDALFDVHAVYNRHHESVEIQKVPEVFRPRVGRFRLHDLNKVYGTSETHNIFNDAQVSPQGAVVVVRPDQYVGGVFSLGATDQLESYFASIFSTPTS